MQRHEVCEGVILLSFRPSIHRVTRGSMFLRHKNAVDSKTISLECIKKIQIQSQDYHSKTVKVPDFRGKWQCHARLQSLSSGSP